MSPGTAVLPVCSKANGPASEPSAAATAWRSRSNPAGQPGSYGSSSMWSPKALDSVGVLVHRRGLAVDLGRESRMAVHELLVVVEQLLMAVEQGRVVVGGPDLGE